MSFGAHHIYPIDTQPSKAVGIAIPFNAPAVFRSTYTTKDATRNNLINYFLTNRPEIYLNPNFGGNIRAFIFEQITAGNVETLKVDIQSQLKIYFPNVFVQKLDILSFPDVNQISVTLNYNLINTNIVDNFSIILQ